MLAITHLPSPKMADCELTYVARSTIDYDRALRQHAGYCRMLRGCGAAVMTLDVNRDLPDCAFIEDTAVVLDEVALMARPGAESRRVETKAIEAEFRVGETGYFLDERETARRDLAAFREQHPDDSLNAPIGEDEIPEA